MAYTGTVKLIGLTNALAFIGNYWNTGLEIPAFIRNFTVGLYNPTVSASSSSS